MPTRKTITVTLDADGEYRLPTDDAHTELCMYYTDDRDDMQATARAEWGDDISIRVRRVDEHPTS